MKAMAKRMAATNPSMRAILPLLMRLSRLAWRIRHVTRKIGDLAGKGGRYPFREPIRRLRASAVTIGALWAGGCSSPGARASSWGRRAAPPPGASPRFVAAFVAVVVLTMVLAAAAGDGATAPRASARVFVGADSVNTVDLQDRPGS